MRQRRDFKIVKGGVFASAEGGFGFQYQKDAYTKNDGLNTEVKNSNVNFTGSACFKGGVKLATDSPTYNFVNVDVSGAGSTCVDGTIGDNNGQDVLNITGGALTFILKVKAEVNGVQLVDYSRKVGATEPFKLVENFIISD